MSPNNNIQENVQQPEKSGFVANYVPCSKKEWVSFVEGVGVSILVGGVALLASKLSKPKGSVETPPPQA